MGGFVVVVPIAVVLLVHIRVEEYIMTPHRIIRIGECDTEAISPAQLLRRPICP